MARSFDKLFGKGLWCQVIMSNNLLNVHKEVKETFRDRIQDNEDLSDSVKDAIIELSDEELTKSEKVQSTVQEALKDED